MLQGESLWFHDKLHGSRVNLYGFMVSLYGFMVSLWLQGRPLWFHGEPLCFQGVLWVRVIIHGTKIASMTP